MFTGIRTRLETGILNRDRCRFPSLRAHQTHFTGSLSQINTFFQKRLWRMTVNMKNEPCVINGPWDLIGREEILIIFPLLSDRIFMQSVFGGFWLQVGLNDRQLRSQPGGKDWKPLRCVSRDSGSAMIHKCGKGGTVGGERRKLERGEDAKEGARGKLRARDPWVICTLADSFVRFSFVQTPNGWDGVSQSFVRGAWRFSSTPLTFMTLWTPPHPSLTLVMQS